LLTTPDAIVAVSADAGTTSESESKSRGVAVDGSVAEDGNENAEIHHAKADMGKRGGEE
jgi:hypothetical protein